MIVNVDEILQKSAQLSAQNDDDDDINVDRPLELDIDVRQLIVTDCNVIDEKSLKANREGYLQQLARDNCQTLFNELYRLPREWKDDALLVNLPGKNSLKLPREKPIPKPRAMTKWEKFAQEKGINKKKKDNLVWDEVLNKWVPRYGYRAAQAEEERDWLVEVSDKADPNVDPFEKKRDDKKERGAKNEFQRLRNIAKSKNVKIPNVGPTAHDNQPSKQLTKAISFARTATASVGKFQDKLPKEKVHPAGEKRGKKRKFDPLMGDMEVEKKKNMAIIDRLLKKGPKINMEKAVNRHIHNEQIKRSEEKKGRAKTGKGSGKKRSGFKRGRKDGKMKINGKAFGGKGKGRKKAK